MVMRHLVSCRESYRGLFPTTRQVRCPTQCLPTPWLAPCPTAWADPRTLKRLLSTSRGSTSRGNTNRASTSRASNMSRASTNRPRCETSRRRRSTRLCTGRRRPVSRGRLPCLKIARFNDRHQRRSRHTLHTSPPPLLPHPASRPLSPPKFNPLAPHTSSDRRSLSPLDKLPSLSDHRCVLLQPSPKPHGSKPHLQIRRPLSPRANPPLRDRRKRPPHREKLHSSPHRLRRQLLRRQPFLRPPLRPHRPVPPTLSLHCPRLSIRRISS